MSAVHNIQRPETVLKKKSNSICYHVVRESVVMGESVIGHVPSVDNPDEICTKVVPGRNIKISDPPLMGLRSLVRMPYTRCNVHSNWAQMDYNPQRWAVKLKQNSSLLYITRHGVV
jgi:hypothetical protein